MPTPSPAKLASASSETSHRVPSSATLRASAARRTAISARRYPVWVPSARSTLVLSSTGLGWASGGSVVRTFTPASSPSSTASAACASSLAASLCTTLISRSATSALLCVRSLRAMRPVAMSASTTLREATACASERRSMSVWRAACITARYAVTTSVTTSISTPRTLRTFSSSASALCATGALATSHPAPRASGCTMRTTSPALSSPLDFPPIARSHRGPASMRPPVGSRISTPGPTDTLTSRSSSDCR